jgi:hypothetical protein
MSAVCVGVCVCVWVCVCGCVQDGWGVYALENVQKQSLAGFEYGIKCLSLHPSHHPPARTLHTQTHTNAIYAHAHTLAIKLSLLCSCGKVYACMHACMYACMYACIHACIHACMHVCMYVCM